MQSYRTMALFAAVAALAPHTDQVAAFQRTATIADDTYLYSAEAPEGRVFAAGDLHPGEGWVDHPRDVPKADRVVSAGELVDAGVNLELLGRATEAEELLGEALSQAEALAGQLADQKTKFDAAWADLTKAKKAVEDENADLRGEIASKDEDIRQLQATIAKFDPDGKPGGSVAKTSK